MLDEATSSLRSPTLWHNRRPPQSLGCRSDETSNSGHPPSQSASCPESAALRGDPRLNARHGVSCQPGQRAQPRTRSRPRPAGLRARRAGSIAGHRSAQKAGRRPKAQPQLQFSGDHSNSALRSCGRGSHPDRAVSSRHFPPMVSVEPRHADSKASDIAATSGLQQLIVAVVRSSGLDFKKGQGLFGRMQMKDILVRPAEPLYQAAILQHAEATPPPSEHCLNGKGS